jgi:hypothetical protein
MTTTPSPRAAADLSTPSPTARFRRGVSPRALHPSLNPTRDKRKRRIHPFGRALTRCSAAAIPKIAPTASR